MKKSPDHFSGSPPSGENLPEADKAPIENISSGLQEGVKGILEHPEDFEKMKTRLIIEIKRKRAELETQRKEQDLKISNLTGLIEQLEGA
jgi:hypothetical protein